MLTKEIRQCNHCGYEIADPAGGLCNSCLADLARLIEEQAAAPEIYRAKLIPSRPAQGWEL